MNSMHLRGDINYAWFNSKIALMGAAGADEITFKEECKNPEAKKQKIDEYRKVVPSPFVAAPRGYLDDNIRPQIPDGEYVRRKFPA